MQKLKLIIPSQTILRRLIIKENSSVYMFFKEFITSIIYDPFAGFIPTLDTIEHKSTKSEWKWKTRGEQLVVGFLCWKNPTTRVAKTLKNRIVDPLFAVVRNTTARGLMAIGAIKLSLCVKAFISIALPLRVNAFISIYVPL